jgi:hypothetical protein
MDKLQWFKFSPTDWTMGKIQRCPELTQARYLRLICLYWNKECILSLEDAEIEIDKEHLDILLSKKIIKSENDFIVIDFLNEQLEEVAEKSQKRREAVLLRWAKVKENNTNEIQNDTNVLQNDTEESRVDKSRVEKIRKDDINSQFFNELLISESWIEINAKNNRSTPDKVKNYLKRFNNNLIAQGDKKVNKKEFMSHFARWLPLEIAKDIKDKPKPTPLL